MKTPRFTRLRHLFRQAVIMSRFQDMARQPDNQSRPTLKELGCGRLPVFAPYVKEDDVFYIVDKFEIIPVRFSWTSIKLREGNAVISAVTATRATELNSREVLIRIVSGREGHGITITFTRKYIYEEDMELPLYRTDKDVLDNRIYKGVVNILDMPFYPAVSSARMKRDTLCLHYWTAGCDKILGTVPEQKKYETSTLFFKENGITVGNRNLDTVPGESVYRTKEESERAINMSLLRSYYANYRQ